MKNRLVKFAGEKAPLVIDSLKGSKVCDVIRVIKRSHPSQIAASIPYIQWSGSTEDKYFLITFYGGILTIGINEREMMLTDYEKETIVAISNHIKEMNVMSTGTEDFNRKVKMNTEYLSEGKYDDDVRNIEFKDVMRILGWKYASRKVKESEFVLEG